MRSVFQQYSQPENRLTHALMCTLNEDRSLLRPFLKWAGARDIPRDDELFISEQQVPGEYRSGDEQEQRGLPDGCVFSEDGWAFLIESKVAAGVSIGQLTRHIKTSERHGYPDPQLLLISVDRPKQLTLARTSSREWRDIYGWFMQRDSGSRWARRFAAYMEAFEVEMIAKNYSIRGTLTKFDGLQFDDTSPYSYPEAKRLIRLLGDELQSRKELKVIGADPKGDRRAAITGRGGSRVWDFIPLRAAKGSSNFTAFPHLTLGIGRADCSAAITVPNGVRGGFRSKLKEIGPEGFADLLCSIEKRTRPLCKKSKGANCKAYALQRHYPSQRSQGIEDAVVRADLRTLTSETDSGVKRQPQWFDAIYGVLTEKRSNIQFGLSTEFSYACPVVRSSGCTDLFADAWTAMAPLLDFVLED